MVQLSLKNISINSIKKINPCRDWMILLIVSGVFIISSSIFDLLFYNNISNGEMYVNINKEDLNLGNLKVDVLKSVVDNFESRKEKISQMEIEYIVDPSI
jgi:hypothetical protein